MTHSICYAIVTAQQLIREMLMNNIISIRNNDRWVLQAQFQGATARLQLVDPWGLPYRGKGFLVLTKTSSETIPLFLNKKLTHLSASNNRFGFHVQKTSECIVVVIGSSGLPGGVHVGAVATGVGLGALGIASVVVLPFPAGPIAGGFLIGAGVKTLQGGLEDNYQGSAINGIAQDILQGGLEGTITAAASVVAGPGAAAGIFVKMGSAAGVSMLGTMVTKGEEATVEDLLEAAATGALSCAVGEGAGKLIQTVGKAVNIHGSAFKVAAAAITGATRSATTCVASNAYHERPLTEGLLSAVLTAAIIDGTTAAAFEVKKSLYLKKLQEDLKKLQSQINAVDAELNKRIKALDPNDRNYAIMKDDLIQKQIDLAKQRDALSGIKALLERENAILTRRETERDSLRFQAEVIVELLMENGYYIAKDGKTVEQTIQRILNKENVTFKSHTADKVELNLVGNEIVPTTKNKSILPAIQNKFNAIDAQLRDARAYHTMRSHFFQRLDSLPPPTPNPKPGILNLPSVTPGLPPFTPNPKPGLFSPHSPLEKHNINGLTGLMQRQRIAPEQPPIPVQTRPQPQRQYSVIQLPVVESSYSIQEELPLDIPLPQPQKGSDRLTKAENHLQRLQVKAEANRSGKRGRAIRRALVVQIDETNRRIQGLKEDLESPYKLPNGDSYMGQMEDGKPHGYGVYISTKGDRYDGRWEYGVEQGRGTLTYANGDVYKGNWWNGSWQGQGTFTNQKGRYEGNWLEGERNGQGVYTKTNGDKYSGAWVHGKRQGYGTSIDHTGEQYRGHWRQGKRHGEGTCAYPNGVTYQGQWSQGQRQGYGNCTYADGRHYSGNWENNRESDHGICTYPNGDRYVGSWNNGFWHGRGTYIYANGETYAGTWTNGRSATRPEINQPQDAIR